MLPSLKLRERTTKFTCSIKWWDLVLISNWSSGYCMWSHCVEHIESFSVGIIYTPRPLSQKVQPRVQTNGQRSHENMNFFLQVQSMEYTQMTKRFSLHTGTQTDREICARGMNMLPVCVCWCWGDEPRPFWSGNNILLLQFSDMCSKMKWKKQRVNIVLRRKEGETSRLLLASAISLSVSLVGWRTCQRTPLIFLKIFMI
jgi:hypothetical protein